MATSEGQTPVAVCVFNRPDHASRLMACLAAYRPTQLLVIADGPRDTRAGEAALCAETRARVLAAVNWPCQILTCFSETNLGCGLRLSTGLDWVFSQVEEAIILEDDCLPTASFFGYCDALLQQYRDCHEVMHIGGYKAPFDISVSEAPVDYVFSTVMHVWGWATWRRAWQRYDFHLTRWPEVRGQKMALGGLRDNRSYWTRALDTLYYEKPHTWDHQWSFACWLHGGLAIVPRVNLVHNIGFDQEGAHGASPWNPLAANVAGEMALPLNHPTEIRESIVYATQLNRWLFSRRRYLWYLLYWAQKSIQNVVSFLRQKRWVLLFFLLVSNTVLAENTRLLEWYYRGNYAAVIRALEKTPVRPEEKLLLANAYIKAEKFASAERLLHIPDYQALGMQPFVAFLQLQLAVEKKDLSQAQKQHTTIVRLRGDRDLLSLRGTIEVARCMLALGQRSEATLLLRSVARKTENPELNYLVEQLVFKNALDVADKTAAQNALKAMCLTGARIREEPALFKQFRLRFGEEVPLAFVFSDNDAVLARAELLLHTGMFQEVVVLLDPWLTKGVSDKAEHIRIQYLLSQAYYFQSKYRDAIVGFQRVLFLGEVPPSVYWPTHMRLGECLLRIQDYAEALRYIRVLQSGPAVYRAAGHALYIRYLMDIRHPADEIVRAVQSATREFPQSPELKEMALEAWYYALAQGYTPLPEPPIAAPVSRFFETWRPKHMAVSPVSHILEQLPLGYTALALLEAEVKPGVSIASEKQAMIKAGFGQFLLAETAGKGYKEDVAKAKVLNLMERPYQAITLLRSRLITAPRDAALWKTLDEDWVKTLFPRMMMQWVSDASQKSGLEPALILSVIRMESTFNTEIKSHAGASGLMQVMPMTARHVAQRLGIKYQTDADLMAPDVNVILGSFYLAEQIRTFKGSLVLALAAYNAGPTAVRRWITLNPDILKKTGREQLALLPYAETRRYVAGILDGYAVYSFLEYRGD
jgi:hypothetical protein